MRRLRFGILALTLIGGRANAATPTPAPQVTTVQTTERVPAGLPLASDTSARARAFRETRIRNAASRAGQTSEPSE